jgi:hypothetical protein
VTLPGPAADLCPYSAFLGNLSQFDLSDYLRFIGDRDRTYQLNRDTVSDQGTCLFDGTFLSDDWHRARSIAKHDRPKPFQLPIHF